MPWHIRIDLCRAVRAAQPALQRNCTRRESCPRDDRGSRWSGCEEGDSFDAQVLDYAESVRADSTDDDELDLKSVPPEVVGRAAHHKGPALDRSGAAFATPASTKRASRTSNSAPDQGSQRNTPGCRCSTRTLSGIESIRRQSHHIRHHRTRVVRRLSRKPDQPAQ